MNKTDNDQNFGIWNMFKVSSLLEVCVKSEVWILLSWYDYMKIHLGCYLDFDFHNFENDWLDLGNSTLCILS